VPLTTVSAGQPIRATSVSQFTRWVTGVTKDQAFNPITTGTSEYTATLTNEDTSAGLILKGVYGSGTAAVTAFTFTKTGATFNVPLTVTAVNAFTATGQTLYGSGGTASALLAAGTARQGYIMSSAATGPTWASSLQSIMTSAGDMVGASAANTPALIPHGTTAFLELVMSAGATGQTWATGVLATVQTVADLVYGAGANTVARLAKGTAFQSLGMASGATAPAWQDCVLAKAATAGQLFYATGANTIAALSAGTNGQFLTLSGGLPIWGAGPAAGITLLDTKAAAAGGTTTSLSFASISASFNELVIIGAVRANTGTSAIQFFQVQFNTDTAANYAYSFNYVLGAANTPNGSTAATTAMQVAVIPDAAATAGEFATLALRIPLYANASIRKTCEAQFSGSYTAVSMFSGFGGGRWASTAAVTSIQLGVTNGLAFHTSTTFYLYGITS
jgi:hypothetical protein